MVDKTVYEKLDSDAKIKTLSELANLPGAKSFYGGHVVFFPADTNVGRFGDFFLSDYAKRIVVPGRHSTNTVSAKRILKKGFEGNPSCKYVENYFHSETGPIDRDHFYAQQSAASVGYALIAELMEKYACLSLEEVKSLDREQIQGTIEEIIAVNETSEERFHHICRGQEYLPKEVASYVQGQVIEALVPIEFIVGHCNGVIRDGKFMRREILVEDVFSPEHIVHVYEPFDIGNEVNLSLYEMFYEDSELMKKQRLIMVNL